MKQAILTVSLAALLAQGGPVAAQLYQNAPPASAAEIKGVPAGTVMTKAFTETLARHSHVGRLDNALDAAPAAGWTVLSMEKDWCEVFPSP